MRFAKRRRVQRIKGIFHRQRPTVGVTHQMQGNIVSRQPRGFAHGKARRRQPHLPVNVRQRAGRGAVTGQAWNHRHKTVLLIIAGKMPDTVRRIC